MTDADDFRRIEGEIPDYPMEGSDFYKKGKFWVSQHNYQMVDTSNDPSFAAIHDVTLRDGEQTPGVTFLEDERVAIAEALSELGVSRIEAGMPVISDAIFNSIKRMIKKDLKAKIYGFSRSNVKDVKLVLDTGADATIVEHCVNPYLCKHAYDLTPESLVKRISEPIKLAKQNGLRTVFMGWDWFRAPVQFTHWLIEALLNEVEFDGLTIVDTVGCTLPEAVEEMIRRFHTWYPKLELEFHGHNDFSLACGCALAAVKGGARVVHASMNGLGQRCGNAATEEVVMALEILKNVRTGVDLSKINRTGRFISEISKVPISTNKPFLGEGNFMEETGTSADLFQKLGPDALDPSVYTPELVGNPNGTHMVLGKNNGKSTIQMKLKKYGITCTGEQVKLILEAVKAEGLITKALVPEENFLYIVKKVKNKA